VYVIPADADEKPMSACMLFGRIQSNSPFLRLCYSCVYGRIDLICVYAIRAYAEE